AMWRAAGKFGERFRPRGALAPVRRRSVKEIFMDRIRRTDLESLLTPRQGPCLSLFMPMHPTGRAGMEDPVRLRKLADEAEELLVKRGMRRPAAEDLVAPVRALPDDNVAWQRRGRSLALFAAPGFFKSFRGNGTMETLVHVNDQFTVRPLLPLV